MELFILYFLLTVVSIYCLILYLRLRRSKVDGQIVVKENEEGRKVFSLELNRSPEEIENMTEITFRVVTNELPE